YKIGLRYTTEGYKFKENKETGTTQTIEGATQVKMDFVEVPMMAEFHVDMLHFKLFADAGIYGGYRLNIERTGQNVADSIRTSFLGTDRRFDYGFVGGVGFGIIFDPFELRISGQFRWGWGTLYDPDYYSEYYYRYAYPINVMINAGIYFHLTRRNGKSKAQLRREARDAVYNPLSPTAQ
ncbi:MAG: outer membrane beta-barrel protein, partial [Candidatus Cryptobacteroides sp.]|nr:outer membrane beta-barrel protein [Candidatus Cryptobacteroides sp.]